MAMIAWLSAATLLVENVSTREISEFRICDGKLEPCISTSTQGKKRIGKPPQNWIHQTKKYIFLTKMNKSSYEESREQDLQILRKAKDRLF